MAIVALPSTRNNSANQNNQFADREPSPYDGLWLNIGMHIKHPETGEILFIRISQGVPVRALQMTNITKRTNPEFAFQANMANRITHQIQKACESLEEGEYRNLGNLTVSLYRQGEAVDLQFTEKDEIDIFGDDDIENGPVLVAKPVQESAQETPFDND